MLNPEIHTFAVFMLTLVKEINKANSGKDVQIAIAWQDIGIVGKYLSDTETFTYSRLVIDDIVDDEPTYVKFKVDFIKRTISVEHLDFNYTVELDVNNKLVAEALDAIRDSCVFEMENLCKTYNKLSFDRLAKVVANQCGKTIHSHHDVYSFIDQLNKRRKVPHPSITFLNTVIAKFPDCVPPRQIHYKKSSSVITIDFKPKTEGV